MIHVIQTCESLITIKVLDESSWNNIIKTSNDSLKYIKQPLNQINTIIIVELGLKMITKVDWIIDLRIKGDNDSE